MQACRQIIAIIALAVVGSALSAQDSPATLSKSMRSLEARDLTTHLQSIVRQAFTNSKHVISVNPDAEEQINQAVAVLAAKATTPAQADDAAIYVARLAQRVLDGASGGAGKWNVTSTLYKSAGDELGMFEPGPAPLSLEHEASVAQQAHARTDDLATVANEVFRETGTSLSAGAQAKLSAFYESVASKIDSDDRLEDAKILIARIAQHIADHAKKSNGKKIATAEDVAKAKFDICPFYPFC